MRYVFVAYWPCCRRHGGRPLRSRFGKQFEPVGKHKEAVQAWKCRRHPNGGDRPCYSGRVATIDGSRGFFNPRLV